jgi:hypothetical protein
MLSSSHEDQDAADQAYRRALRSTGESVRAAEQARIAEAEGHAAVDGALNDGQPAGGQPPAQLEQSAPPDEPTRQ